MGQDQVAPGAWMAKSRRLIEAVDVSGALRLREWRLFDVLLHAAVRKLQEGASHSVSITRVTNVMGADAADLEDTIARLTMVTVTIPAAVPGEPPVASALLDPARTRIDGDAMTYAFPPEVALAGAVGVKLPYAKLALATIAALRTLPGLRLYQRLALAAPLATPIWDAALEDVRSFVGAVAPSYGRAYSAFRQRVLDPGVADVNACAELDASYLARRCGRGAPVTRVRFLVGLKPPSVVRRLPGSPPPLLPRRLRIDGQRAGRNASPFSTAASQALAVLVGGAKPLKALVALWTEELIASGIDRLPSEDEAFRRFEEWARQRRTTWRPTSTFSIPHMPSIDTTFADLLDEIEKG